MDCEKLKKVLPNKSIVFLDLWGTIFIENNLVDLNLKRAEILNNILGDKYEVNYLKEQIEKNISTFKEQEKFGKSITVSQRIESILKNINFQYKSNLVERIITSFDNLYFHNFKPSINTTLLELISSKKIILVSNIGLVTSKCIEKLLDYYGINHHFYKKYYSDKSLYCKPNPRFLEKIIIDNSITKESCIYIGDSYEMDYQLCSKMGIDCCINKWGIDL